MATRLRALDAITRRKGRAAREHSQASEEARRHVRPVQGYNLKDLLDPALVLHRLLVVVLVLGLAFWHRGSVEGDLLVGKLAEEMGDTIEAGLALVVGANDVPRGATGI